MNRAGKNDFRVGGLLWAIPRNQEMAGELERADSHMLCAISVNKAILCGRAVTE
jgi:hypothetical protein